MDLGSWFAATPFPPSGGGNQGKSLNDKIVSRPSPLRGPLTQRAVLQSSRRDALMAQDARTKASFAAGGKSAGLADFQETPLSGATTLFDYARQASGFDPTITFPGVCNDASASAASSAQVTNYFAHLTACPMFATANASDFWEWPNPNSHGVVTEDIVSECVFGPLFERQPIPAAWNESRARLDSFIADVRTHGVRRCINPFYGCAVIHNSDDDIEIQIIVATLDLWKINDFIVNGYVASNGLWLAFHARRFKALAAQIADQHYQSVADWLDSN
jgi:hypothetical protein